MSQTNNNNKTILHAGVDVAKATLQFSLAGRRHQLKNNKQGHVRVLKLLGAAEAAQPGVTFHVVLEASGGYEAALVHFLHEAKRPLSVVQPGRVRHFAKAKNQLAKSDPIDAEMLVEFGQAIQPAPSLAPTPAQKHLNELVRRRAQLVDTRTAELNRAAHYMDKLLCQQSRQLLKLLDKQIAQIERAMTAQIAAEEEMAARVARLQQVPGVGPVVAAVLQAEMPELGTLSDGEAAALAGLAPYTRDSGPYKGTRRILGGRAPARCALYMAALSAVRHDPILRRFYLWLRGAGKKPLVALTAVMRKLIVLLNRMLKNPQFKLSAPVETTSLQQLQRCASARWNKLAQQLDGGAAVCSGARGSEDPNRM
jgi:transposase